jgi:hypothetical protein
MHPRDAARALERSRDHGGSDPLAEHMAGYGLTGLTFDAGHVIAFQRLTASSIGPPHMSIWHRHPDGRWVIHTNVEPSRACPRYFGPALDSCHVDDIELTWNGPADLSIAASRARLHLAMRLAPTPLTRVLGAAARAAPGRLLARRRTGSMAGWILNAGTLSLAGTAPAGHQFIIRPRALWRIAAAAAVIEGRDAGSVTTPAEQAALGELLIPTRGLFATGRVMFAPHTPVARF